MKMILLEPAKYGYDSHRIGIPLLLFFLALIVFPWMGKAAEEQSIGKQIFEKRCTGCHSLESNKEGPRLKGVYGRQAGTVPDFNYSAALKTSHFIWDEEQLNKWLADTQSLVPDNNMDFHVANSEERVQIIEFLKVISKSQSGDTAKHIEPAMPKK